MPAKVQVKTKKTTRRKPSYRVVFAEECWPMKPADLPYWFTDELRECHRSHRALLRAASRISEEVASAFPSPMPMQFTKFGMLRAARSIVLIAKKSGTGRSDEAAVDRVIENLQRDVLGDNNRAEYRGDRIKLPYSRASIVFAARRCARAVSGRSGGAIDEAALRRTLVYLFREGIIQQLAEEFLTQNAR